MSRQTPNRDCLYGGCYKWDEAQRNGERGYIPECWRCGFNVLEAARRRQIPLTLCKDGLRRKIIPKKPIGENDPEEELQDE